MNRPFLVKDSKYSNVLQRRGFPSTLCASEYSCEKWANFCKKSNMKFLKGSYGTLVHKNFEKYFDRFKRFKQLQDRLDLPDYVLDHANGLISKINDVDIITSSEHYISYNFLCDYPHSIYIINGNFLEDYRFTRMNLAYTDAPQENIDEINQTIYKDTGIWKTFTQLPIL